MRWTMMSLSDFIAGKRPWMTYEYTTQDRVNVLEVSPEDVEFLPYVAGYSVALMVRNYELTTSMLEDNRYTFPSAQLLEDLLGDEDGGTLSPMLLEKHLKGSDLYHFRVNTAVLPDSATDLPYDELLGSFGGALHGAHALLRDDNGGAIYYSPGQVLDISHYLSFSGIDLDEIGHVALRAFYRRLRDFFVAVAGRQEAVFYRLKGSEE